jgi:hypothetical protein
LSKYYVDTITLLQFFKNTDPLKWKPMGIAVIDQLFSCAKDLYGALNAFGQSVPRSAWYEPQAFLEQLQDFLVACRSGGERLPRGEVTLDQVFSHLDETFEFRMPTRNPCWESFQGIIKGYFGGYLAARYSSLSAADLLDSVYKIYAMVVGAELGDYYACTAQVGVSPENLEKLDKVMRRGIMQ